jgi:hypothetical protein
VRKLKARPRLLKALALTMAVLSATPVAVHAQSTNTTTTSPYIPNIAPQIPDFLKPIVERGLGLLYAIGWVVVIGAGIYGAIEWARGDSEKGRKVLGGVIIGAIILAILPMFIKWLLGG